MVYYRRSPFLIMYWNENNKLTLYNYNRYVKVMVSKEIVKILEVLPEWTSTGEIFHKLDYLDKSDLKKTLAQLTRLKVVHMKPVSKGDNNTNDISNWTQWNPIELALQRERSYVELLPVSRNKKKPLNPFKRFRGLASITMPRVSYNDGPKRALQDILEERKSIRKYGDNYINMNDLSSFLYRCARIKKILYDKVVWGHILTRRPYPSGGARYPLEIYPVNNKITDLQRGIYYYDPHQHKLVHINKNERYQKKLNAYILRGVKPLMNREPDVVLVITAVFARTMRKYKNIGLSLIMSDLGCLYQTMYLVATEMNLAPCALGGTNEELVRDWLHLNWFEESHVGIFMLGKKPNC
jgi:SagB-type dehydrogenase family enzyme